MIFSPPYLFYRQVRDQFLRSILNPASSYQYIIAKIMIHLPSRLLTVLFYSFTVKRVSSIFWLAKRDLDFQFWADY